MPGPWDAFQPTPDPAAAQAYKAYAADQADQGVTLPEPKYQPLVAPPPTGPWTAFTPQAPPPTIDLLDNLPLMPPGLEEWVQSGSVGRIMSAFGQSAVSAFGPEQLGIEPGSETDMLAKKAGIFNKEGQPATIFRTFNEAMIKPLAAYIDLGARALGAVQQGAAAGVGQTLAEAGAPEAGREAAAFIEHAGGLAGSPEALRVPHAPELSHTIEEARAANVIGSGGEAAWKGIEEPPAPEARAGEEAAAAQQEAPEQPPAASEAPAAPPPDIHQVARQVAPQTFQTYDALAQQRDTFRRWIGELDDSRKQDATENAPHNDAIAALEEQIAGRQDDIQTATPRLAKKYQSQIDGWTAERERLSQENQDWINEKTTGDSPDMWRVRVELMKTDYRMRDLAPEVSAAYREAQARMPPVEAVAPEIPAATAPVAAPAEETPQIAPAAVVPPEPAAAATPAAAPPLNIAADVSRQLVAAGRPADEAAAAAALVQAHYEARAARFDGAKGTAEDLYRAEAPEIRQGRASQAALELAQPQAGTLEQGKRGSITLKDSRNTIKLFKNADASTFIHETGHQWLEELMRDARDEAAPADLTKDAQTVRDWLGAKGDTIARAQHEKFARGFERYMMEGRAPSVALADVFAKFKDWLTRIYRTVSQLRSPITDDIRDVFDRLVSTPDEKPVIAPEREEPGNIADRHEEIADRAEPGTPSKVAADTIRAEADDFARQQVPEIADEIGAAKPGEQGTAGPGAGPEGRGGGDGGGSSPGGAPDRGRNAGQPDTGRTGGGEDPGTVSAGGSEGAAQGNDAGPGGRGTVFERVPREPVRLISWLRSKGGIKDPNGDLAHILDVSPNRSGGLINNKRGMSLDDATNAAWEGKYLEGEERPDINALLDAIESDRRGSPVYSAADADAVEVYRGALQRNAEIARLAQAHGIPIEGLTKAEFFDRLAEAMSHEEAAAEAQSLSDSVESEFQKAEDRARAEIESKGDAWEPEKIYNVGPPRSLEDLENERRQEDAAGAAGPIQTGHEESGPVGRDEGGVQAGGGQSGGGARPGRGPDQESGAPDLIDKAGNLRLDKINGPDDMNDALREIARQNGDFMDARYGDRAYRQAVEIRNTRVLLRLATDDYLKSAGEAAKGSPEAIADYVIKQQRAAMVFDKLSSMSSDWAHAGHELNRVMPGFERDKDIAAQIQSTTGMTLFQIQEQAALVQKLESYEQQGKFASDVQKTRWEKIKAGVLSYFINNLISGPITHGAYSVGNTTFALFKALPETAFQAASGMVREAVAGEPVDRVHLGESMAQLYGMVRGARDGFVPAMQALKTGMPFMKGLEDRELGLEGMAPARPQSIPGKLGYVLETPSRSVAAIHTMFYSIGYEQALARLAYRDAATKELRGDAFNKAVAAFTQSPPEAAIEAAHQEAMEQVLMRQPAYGGQLYHLQQLVNKDPSGISKIIMPFMQIGSNILREGIVERSALAMLMPDARADIRGLNGGAARDIRLGKIAVGTSLGIAVVGLAAEGIITGGGPTDRNQLRVKEDTGWKPYSLKWGNVYIPYRKYLGPLAPLVALHADLYEVAGELSTEGIGKAAAASGLAMAEVVADETWMTGLSNFIDAARHWDTSGERYMRGLATSFIPFSVGLSQTARMADPYAREARTLIDAVRAKLPGVSQELQPRIGIWGLPVPSSTMVSPSTAHEDPVDQRLISLGMGVTAPERKIRGVDLSPEQYANFARISGRYAKMQLDALVAQPGFSSLPGEVQKDIIRKSIDAARERARALVMMQSLNSANDIVAKATDAKRLKVQ
jgi:hypothetical protein